MKGFAGILRQDFDAVIASPTLPWHLNAHPRRHSHQTPPTHARSRPRHPPLLATRQDPSVRKATTASRNSACPSTFAMCTVGRTVHRGTAHRHRPPDHLHPAHPAAEPRRRTRHHGRGVRLGPRRTAPAARSRSSGSPRTRAQGLLPVRPGDRGDRHLERLKSTFSARREARGPSARPCLSLGDDLRVLPYDERPARLLDVLDGIGRRPMRCRRRTTWRFAENWLQVLPEQGRLPGLAASPRTDGGAQAAPLQRTGGG